MFDLNKIEQIKSLFSNTERAHQEEVIEPWKKDPEWPFSGFQSGLRLPRWYRHHRKRRSA